MRRPSDGVRGEYAPRGPRWALAARLALYNLLLALCSPLLGVWLLWRGVVRGKGLGCFRHRLGLVPRLPQGGGPRVWLHAVSAGEMSAAGPVLEALLRELPEARVVVSTVTPAGMTMAEKTCGRAHALFYLPFDGPGCMMRALRRVRPDLVVVAEKEMWPNFLGLAVLMGARVQAVNGRVSDRMVSRARWAPGFVRWLYRLPDLLCVQSEQDARRLVEIGVPATRILVAGNTKADNLAERDAESEARLAGDLGLEGPGIWLVAGSTHPGEEEIILEAFLAIRKEIPEVRLLLAPRHLDRVASVSAAVAERGISAVRRSEATGSAGEGVVILDTMGELRAAYAFGTAGFVGGTLVPIGGHNLLEPVAAGRAVLFGPHTENCSDVSDLVREWQVGFQVQGAGELAEEFLRIARDPERQRRIASKGRELIVAQRGAAQRCADAARALLGLERHP